MRTTERTARAMDKLTERDRYGNARMRELKTYGLINLDIQKKTISDHSLAGLCFAVDRLAAYEDTGLSPEEVAALIAENKRLHELVDTLDGVIKEL